MQLLWFGTSNEKAILFSLVLLVFFASTKCGNLEKEKAKYLLLYMLLYRSS